MKLAGVICLMLTVLAGCGKKAAVATTAPALPGSLSQSREYVELEPGWRLRIVAAVTKSGRYDVDFKPVRQEGNVITLKASDDMLGYETAFWSLTGRPGGGVSLQLASAVLTVDGKPSPIAKPTRALVHAPRSAHYLRAFYLTRKSDADHNMALAGAARRDQLEAFARAFHDSPDSACAEFVKQHHYCEWIPAALAVRPEAPIVVNGVRQWPPQ